MRYRVFYHVLLSLLVTSAASAQPARLQDILIGADHCQTVFSHCFAQIQVVTSNRLLAAKTVRELSKYELCKDDKRFNLVSHYWEIKELTERPAETKAIITRELWDGKVSYYNVVDTPQNLFRLTISPPNLSVEEGDGRARHNFGITDMARFQGVFEGDDLPYQEILRHIEPGRIEVKDINYGTKPSVLIETSTDGGKYQLWLDPEHGFNLVHAVVTRSRNDLFYGERLSTPSSLPPRVRDHLRRLGYPTAAKVQLKCVVDVNEFENRGDKWFPVKGTCRTETDFEDGTSTVKDATYSCSSFDLTPDFDRLGAFQPNFKDGTHVEIRGQDSVVPLCWRNGKVVSDAKAAGLEEVDKMIDSFGIPPSRNSGTKATEGSSGTSK